MASISKRGGRLASKQFNSSSLSDLVASTAEDAIEWRNWNSKGSINVERWQIGKQASQFIKLVRSHYFGCGRCDGRGRWRLLSASSALRRGKTVGGSSQGRQASAQHGIVNSSLCSADSSNLRCSKNTLCLFISLSMQLNILLSSYTSTTYS